MIELAHHYVPPAGGRLLCACGHPEPFTGDADISGAMVRQNDHIRSSYTDEEWEAMMQEGKIAVLDRATGELKMPPEGSKS